MEIEFDFDSITNVISTISDLVTKFNSQSEEFFQAAIYDMNVHWDGPRFLAYVQALGNPEMTYTNIGTVLAKLATDLETVNSKYTNAKNEVMNYR